MIDRYIDETRADKTVLNCTPSPRAKIARGHSLSISPLYVCFLPIRFPLYVPGSYYRLARVRFAWLRSSREDSFQSTFGDPSSTRSFDESIAASIRYTRPIRNGQIAREYPLPYPGAYFLEPGHDHPSTSRGEIFSLSVFRRIPQTSYFTA